VRGFPVDVLKGFAGSFFLERLFNKYSTVHTATQSCHRQEKQPEASDEAIVVKMSVERRMERRASVI
jgi:hypothetical protein